VKNRFAVVLLACAVLAAAGIGLLLTGRSRGMTPQQAARECRRQVPSADPQALASCIRSKQYPRSRPHSRFVLIIPLGLGGTAVAVLFVVSRRGKTGMACPICGSETAPDDEDCLRCGYPLRAPDDVPAGPDEPGGPDDAGPLGPSDADPSAARRTTGPPPPS
jgi:hypothetical protein